MNTEYEIRNDSAGEFDELVVSEPVSVHIERMDDREWWMGIELASGSRIRVAWTGDVPVVEVE